MSLDLDAIEARNLGCHQCEEGRPHSHRPDEKPYILNETVQKLVKELREARGWEVCAAQFSRNSDYYRGLLDQAAVFLGPEVFVSDDGSVQDSPLRAKVPELVRKLAEEVRSLRGRLYTRDPRGSSNGGDPQ